MNLYDPPIVTGPDFWMACLCMSSTLERIVGGGLMRTVVQITAGVYGDKKAGSERNHQRTTIYIKEISSWIL